MRVRCSGIIEIDGGYALMFRKNVKRDGRLVSYYTIPGGGLEPNETVEEGAKREIEEELGIVVEIEKLILKFENREKTKTEYFYKCKYVGGEFGTGQGPEFTNDPKYKDRGEYIPVIVKKEELKKINLLPPLIKKYLI